MGRGTVWDEGWYLAIHIGHDDDALFCRLFPWVRWLFFFEKNVYSCYVLLVEGMGNNIATLPLPDPTASKLVAIAC